MRESPIQVPEKPLTFHPRAQQTADRRRDVDDAGNVIETHEQAGDFKEW